MNQMATNLAVLKVPQFRPKLRLTFPSEVRDNTKVLSRVKSMYCGLLAATAVCPPADGFAIEKRGSEKQSYFLQCPGLTLKRSTLSYPFVIEADRREWGHRTAISFGRYSFCQQVAMLPKPGIRRACGNEGRAFLSATIETNRQRLPGQDASSARK